MNNYFELILAAIPGIVAIITLAVKLVEYVQKATKEKNWGEILRLTLAYMEEAEEKFRTGAERKEWVLGMVKASSKTVNYDVDMDAVSILIDQLCAMTKKVNPPSAAAE